MELERLTAQMDHNARAVHHLAQGVSLSQARWRPTEDDWSILDVVNHLAYEEEHDFRARLDLALHRPHEPWPAADPARGVTEESRQRTLEHALAEFLSAREESLAWLADLEDPAWETSIETPFGGLRAGDILASWVGHDLLHVRQLTELRWALLDKEVEPYELRYAGD
jgi:hypothetical protein